MSHLGDIAQALPLIHAVREIHPDAEIAWAVQPEFADLVGPLAHVIPFERRGGARAWPRIGRALRAFGPDLALDAQGNWKSAAATRLSGAPRCAGFARSAWQEPGASRLFRIETVESADGAHLVDRVRKLAEATLGVRPDRLDPLLSTAEMDEGSALLLEAFAGEAPEAPVLLHPGVRGDPRSWPEERFERLGRELSREGRSLAVLTGPGEVEIGERLERALPGAGHLVGQRGLRRLAALFARTAERGGVVVTGDSGPAHVAASVGLRVCLIAGPEDPSRTGPFGAQHVVAGDRGLPTWVPREIESVSVQDVLDAL